MVPGGLTPFTPKLKSPGGLDIHSIPIIGNHVLITPDDEARVAQISEAGAPTSEETSWLCALVQRLARLKPTEEDFPAYAALINSTSSSAFAMRFVGAFPLERETRLLEGHPAQLELFDHTTENAVCDALLCIRPYIRLVEPHDERMLDRLARHGLLRVSLDGERVFDGSAEEHLIGFDGYGLRRKPFQFQATGCLFSGADLEQPLLTSNLNIPAEGEGAPGTKRGVFLPNSSRITIHFTGITLQRNEQLLLSTGLVAGSYTTRADGVLASPPGRRSRKEWDPRD